MRGRQSKAGGSYVTIGQVAEAANVSPMTVSNFINGRFGHMREETRQRVAQAVESLNYRPNNAARGLRRAENASIGIIVVDESPRYLSDGYTNEVIAGLTNSLNAAGLTLQLEGRTAAQFRDSSLIRGVRTDGLCVMLSGPPQRRRRMLEALHQLNQPIVVLLEKYSTRQKDICCVMQDDRGGGELLARHLIEHGARKLLFLRHSMSRWRAVDERERGIQDAVAMASAKTTLKVLACGNGSIDEVHSSLTAEIDANGLPDCVMGASDKIGIAALKMLNARGISVPDDVAITGFNASEVWQYSDLKLTTIGSRGYEIGQEAGNQMVARLGTGTFSTKVVELPVDLILGDSTPGAHRVG